MKVQIVTERGDALIATAFATSFNRRADQYTDEQNEGLQLGYGPRGSNLGGVL